MIISLIGYMGSGKSLIAKELALKINYLKIDLDNEIEKKNQQKIEILFKTKGELFFRKEEHHLLKEFLTNDANKVLSLGGGCPTYYNNMELINEKSTSVYLRGTPSILSQRLKNQKTKRPLIAHLKDEDLPEFIAKHLFERNAFYNQANIIVDIEHKTPEQLVLEITLHLDRLWD